MEDSLEEEKGASPPSEVSYRHEAIVDEMLANPFSTQADIAAKLGYTQSWLSTVTNSGTFRAYYERRRREFNETLAEQAQKKSLEVGMKALDKAAEGLETGDVDPVEVFDKALNRAGMAPSKGTSGGGEGQTNIQNNYVTATQEELAAARQRMIPHEQSPEEEGPKEIEHTASREGGES